jgi:hypothetical protein
MIDTIAVESILKQGVPKVHISGERPFVDFAGHTMGVIDAVSWYRGVEFYLRRGDLKPGVVESDCGECQRVDRDRWGAASERQTTSGSGSPKPASTNRR